MIDEGEGGERRHPSLSLPLLLLSMLSSGIPYLDLTTLLKFLLSAFIVGAAAVRVVRDTASKHLIVGRFGGGADSDAYRPEAARYVMAVDEVAEDVCCVCRSPTSKKCARCKVVRYW